MFLQQPLEDAIRKSFIPALLGESIGYAISDIQRDLFALPARLGGLAIDNPVIEAKHKHQESVELSQSLKDLIKPPTVTATCDGSPKEGHTEDDAIDPSDGNQEDNKEGNAESISQNLNPQAKKILKIWAEQKE